MSFIEQSEQNIDRLMKEVSGGGVVGFVGGRGMGIDALFAGPYHPDSGHGSKNKQLLAKQLKDRKKLRKDIESSRDGVIDNYSGLADPVGGYYEIDTEVSKLAYDELDMIVQSIQNFNYNNTPLQDFEWIEIETNLEYDEPGEAYKIKDIVYDDEPTYAGENFINQSETNWKIIKGI